ncbi:MAG: hypothetical protein L6R40_003512 [Gallowayella cf. fulva]|nr:MAG: hypothetical protein L6R40_003512 [Xanthomendoza cf. fulva]
MNSYDTKQYPGQDGTESNASSQQAPSPATVPPRSPRATSGALATAMKQTKTRKRKGSLRKTALLGTGRLRTDQVTKSEANKQDDDATVSEGSSEPQSPEDLPTPAPLPKVQPPVPWVSHPVHGILHKALIEHTPAGKLHKSPTLSSTTDEDDILNPASTLTAQELPVPPKASLSSASSTSDSYFPPQVAGIPRRTRHSPKSPLSTIAAEALPPPEEWDYSETRCWAWDVGETPYAPPELEDDPTLPIVGYYPALIILTGVMAWVWVTVAWVGMKYFKHAKMGGEDEV